jgi:phosphate starvation-inducible PhoH-like protein
MCDLEPAFLKGDHIVTKHRARKTKNTVPQNVGTISHQVVDFQNYKNRKKNVVILPKNIKQEDYIELLDNNKIDLVFAIGPAGTGKTMIAVLAAIRALKNGECEKIVVTRPAVSVDEQHGFLPGNLVEKMAPWTRPIFDVIEEYYSPIEIEAMIKENIIEVAPLAYMRGRTFKNAYILFDEAQNCTPNQMKMILTRLGENSRIIVTGDLKQHDRTFDENGLKDFLDLLQNHNSSRMGVVEFSRNDVERHPTVRDVLRIYGDEK